MIKRLLAEFIGTFVLVLGGCGAAVYATSATPGAGIGWLGVSFAFGLSVLVMAYAVGRISGGHFNPAVTLGLVVAGRHSPLDLVPYWLFQLAGSVAAAAVIYVVLQGAPTFAETGTGGFATNGFGDLSPMGYSMQSALIIEAVLTAVFLIVILGVTASSARPPFAPLAIGLALVLIHLISIPVTNTSVNPARSTGVAIFADTEAMKQLWVFWVAPLVGALVGAVIWRMITIDD
ncbi:MAG: aquaporin Z [Marinibacterium sp.]|nr:aquaporin Z [Marinibacterium sp.]